jgi:RNA 2',3'-cyclic 3'-phosphodiesterase
VRLFVGLELDEAVRVAAAAVAARLESRVADLAGDFKARWIPGSNLHITIWFFGEVSDEAAAILFEQLRAPLGVPAFELAVRGCGAFPRSGAPRVLWIGTGEGTPSMVAAHAALADRLAPLNYRPEARAYSPHVTMARVKEPGRRARAVRQALADEAADCGRTIVAALTLFRSRLSPRGAVYEPLLRVPLA